MNDRPIRSPGEGGERYVDQHVYALQAAYRAGRLVVSADPGALSQARVHDGHAIDARDVADAMLRELLRSEKSRG